MLRWTNWRAAKKMTKQRSKNIHEGKGQHVEGLQKKKKNSGPITRRRLRMLKGYTVNRDQTREGMGKPVSRATQRAPSGVSLSPAPLEATPHLRPPPPPTLRLQVRRPELPRRGGPPVLQPHREAHALEVDRVGGVEKRRKRVPVPSACDRQKREYPSA